MRHFRSNCQHQFGHFGLPSSEILEASGRLKKVESLMDEGRGLRAIWKIHARLRPKPLRIASAELILHPLAIPRVSVPAKMIIFSDLIAAS